MIIWLNGTFGVGKTTTARELAATMPDTRLFDPEMVGYLLRDRPVHRPAPARHPVRPERELLAGGRFRGNVTRLSRAPLA